VVTEDVTAERGASRNLRFALAKFRPAVLPAALVTRSVLHDQLTAGGWPASDRGGGVGWGGQERAVVDLDSNTATTRRDFLAFV